MNTKEITSELRKRLEIDSNTVDSLLQTTISTIKEELQNGNTVALQGFGTFEVKKKGERISVNPITKQRVLIPPKLAVGFKASAVLKDKLNS